MTEVHFYHLKGRPLEAALPQLLEKCLERGWRCVVQASSPERVEALDQHLWTFDDASFLPHGTDRQPEPQRQPVLLTDGDGNPNGAQVRFLVENATLHDAAAYERVIHMFDDGDPAGIDRARQSWRVARAAGHDVTYWQQDSQGRWARK